MQRFRDQHGDKPVGALRREHVLLLIGKMRPWLRRNWLKAVRPLLRFGVEVAVDPTADIKIKFTKTACGAKLRSRPFAARNTREPRESLAFELLLATVPTSSA